MSLLALLNPSKAFLAVSIVLAGYCLLRFNDNTAGNLLVVPYLLASGALLAMADSAWRALFTAAAGSDNADSGAKAGVLTTTASYVITVFITLGGLMCAMTGGYNSFRAAGVMIVLMLARSALFRRTEIISPLLCGLSQGLLYVLGMTAHPSYIDILHRDARMPLVFFTVYSVLVSVLAQVRDSSRPRAAPTGEDLASETASRLLDVRDDAVDRIVASIGGGALVLLPLVAGWILQWRWLSWTFFIFLALSLLAKLIPVLAYGTRKDMGDFIESAWRGAAYLNAGCIASLAYYQNRIVYEGFELPLPGRLELATVAAIALLSMPAWLLRRVAPLE